MASTINPMKILPDRNLAYPVLINLADGGSGSGFFVNTGDAAYLVTANHVICELGVAQLRCGAAEILSYSVDPKDKVPNVMLLDLATLLAANQIRFHQYHDVAVIKIATTERSRRTSSRLPSSMESCKKACLGPVSSVFRSKGSDYMRMSRSQTMSSFSATPHRWA